MPPTIAATMVQSDSSGMTTVSATTRGSIRRCDTDMPSVVMASIPGSGASRRSAR
jgi:hypothetical protein